ncbi:MAG TPA: amidohydrolase, partial [Candidatus Lachnoclostridium stercorigallinarum]|nr:amidohydrolase [Candidatus Lachnoclostridium stercorigallinarum]
MEKTMELAIKNRDYVIGLRRYFHQHPELGGEEFNTSRRVMEELKEMGLEPRVIGSFGTCVVCDIHGDHPGKTIALRADMDALNVQELIDCPYKSETDGVMHA